MVVRDLASWAKAQDGSCLAFTGMKLWVPEQTKGCGCTRIGILGSRGLGGFDWAAGVIVWVTSKGLVLGQGAGTDVGLGPS